MFPKFIHVFSLTIGLFFLSFKGTAFGDVETTKCSDNYSSQSEEPKKNSNISENKSEDKSDNANKKEKSVEEKDKEPVAEKEKDKEKKPVEEKEEKEKKEEPKSPHTFTGSVSFVSDYRFRGISQTMRRPAVQGGFDYSHKSGFYLGTWASNVDGTSHYYNNTSMEWDFYGGYKNKPFSCWLPDLIFNIGVIYYYYPGGRAHVPQNTRYNTCEYYVEFTYKWLNIKLWQSLTNYFGINSDDPPTNFEKDKIDRPNGSSKGSTYIEAAINFDIWQKLCLSCFQGGKLNLLLHVGHLTIRNYENLNYTDWRVTLTQEFDWFNIFITYVGTNAKHAYYDVPDNSFHPKKRHLGAQGFVIGVIKTF